MANEICPRCQGPGCAPHPCPLGISVGLGSEDGCTCCGRCALLCAAERGGLSDKEWEALHERFVSEHTPVTLLEGNVFFAGWTTPRAWWEDDEREGDDPEGDEPPGLTA